MRSVSRRAAMGLTAAAAFAALTGTALADEAVAFVQSLYALPNLWGDVTADDAAIARYLAPDLAALVKANNDNPDPDAALDYDPLVQAQDFQDVKATFTVKSESDMAATVEASVENFDASTSVTLDLVKTPAGWRLANLHGPDGPSLADALKQLNSGNGGGSD